MDKTINKNTDNSVDNETINNLTKNLLNKEKSADLNSIMQLMSTLLKGDSLLGAVGALDKMKQNSNVSDSNVSEQQDEPELSPISQMVEVKDNTNIISELKKENKVLSSLTDKLEALGNEISELKKELQQIKKQNNKILKKMIKKNKK